MFRDQDLPFQIDRPVFFRLPITAGGRKYKAGDEFKWKEMGTNPDRVKTMYRERQIHHNSDLEIERRVGDGLEHLDIVGLHHVVDNINQKVKDKTNTQQEFDKKKCKKSKILDKQRGLIRSWRRNYGQYEAD